MGNVVYINQKAANNAAYELISKDIGASINGIYYRGNNTYEVSYGVWNAAAYYVIIDGVIVSTQFD